METIAGPFEIDWEREDLELVRRTIVKKYNAEIYSQSTLEGPLELKEEHGFSAGEIERVELETFDVAFDIIGGGEEGEKHAVRTKEEADHSLPYMLAPWRCWTGRSAPPSTRPRGSAARTSRNFCGGWRSVPPATSAGAFRRRCRVG
jgi:2-methylcitrate dehydratase